jgi:hypothetical protein
MTDGNEEREETIHYNLVTEHERIVQTSFFTFSLIDRIFTKSDDMKELKQTILIST